MIVAIIDDAPEVRVRIKQALAMVPRVSCVEASNAREGLAMINRVRPEAIVLDLSMPVGGGLGLLLALQSMTDPPAVIVLTMHDTPEYRSRCAELGARFFLRKPTDLGTLPDIIGELVKELDATEAGDETH